MVLDHCNQIIRYKHIPHLKILTLSTIVYEIKVLESTRNQIINICLWSVLSPVIAVHLSINTNTAKKIHYQWEETEDYAFAFKSSALKKLNELDLTHIRQHLQYNYNQHS